MNSKQIMETWFLKETPKMILGIIVSYIILSYFISLSAFVSQSEEQRWDTGVFSFDQSEYSHGDTVNVTGYLTEGTEFISEGEYFSFTNPETITWIVTIMDPVSKPVYYSDGVIIDAQGDLTVNSLTYTIPDDPKLGTYTVKVFAITDYLPNGEIRVNLVNEATFEVIS